MAIQDFEQRFIDATDKVLLDWLENGITEFSGQCDEQGEPIMIRKPLVAAQMQCVLKRITQLKLSSVPVKGTATGNLLEAAQMRFKGRSVLKPLPAVSEDDDAATG